MIKLYLGDGGGTKQSVYVKDNALLVTQVGHPPFIQQKKKIFRQYLTIDGTATGSNDMGIDGSSTPVKFYIVADNDNDIYITALNFLVGYGASAGLWEFSDSNAALTNGHRLYYTREGEEVDIHDAIKTNYDLIRLSVVGMLPTAWELRHLGAANDYGYLCTVPLLTKIPPYGIKLDRGSSQKLIFEVRDDNSDADDMNAIVYGFERFE